MQRARTRAQLQRRGGERPKKMAKGAFLAVAVAAAALAAAAGAGQRVKVDPASGQYVEREGGRVRFFHGVNVVYKLKPYVPIMDHFDVDLSMAAEDIENLRRWGMNVVRLGVMWTSVETAPGAWQRAGRAALRLG